MPRFVLIDPSLVSTAGHHFDYARHVLGAAGAAGFKPIVAGHRECRLPVCGAWPIRPTFRDGLWTHQASSARLRGLGYAVSALQRLGRPFEGIRGFVTNWRDGVRARRFAEDACELMAELRPEQGDLV